MPCIESVSALDPRSLPGSHTFVETPVTSEVFTSHHTVGGASDRVAPITVPARRPPVKDDRWRFDETMLCQHSS